MREVLPVPVVGAIPHPADIVTPVSAVSGVGAREKVSWSGGLSLMRKFTMLGTLRSATLSVLASAGVVTCEYIPNQACALPLQIEIVQTWIVAPGVFTLLWRR